ncbi:helix-turn-helix domain-containing protein [Streptacidiphilus sp. MAP5-3]|uniref:helix-turn-helix domain-containing protein n=1 Tax=unclassified Streptacidiphilus TaxID=2643834 RepID=UPI003511879C
MTTDFQRGREALGARLRQLRAEAGLSGREVGRRLDWPPSKVSKLENGKQTPTPADLDAWALAVGQPEAAAELKGRLNGLETSYRSWRRQLATGHRARQEEALAHQRRTELIRAYESTVIHGMFQTPEYARHLLLNNADLRGTPRDTEAAVQARMRRQELLYEPGHVFHAVLWEGALRVLPCPVDVMIGQLDRLSGLIGLSTVKLGVVPFGAQMSVTPRHGFWIYDHRLVIVETVNAELWLDDADDLTLYERVWQRLDQAAVYGRHARRLMALARASLETPRAIS